MAEFPTLLAFCADGQTWLEVGEVARLLPSLKEKICCRDDVFSVELPGLRKEVVELLGRQIHDLVDSYGYQLDRLCQRAREGDISLDLPRENLLDVFRALEELQELRLAEVFFHSELQPPLHYNLLLEICDRPFYRSFAERLRQIGLEALEYLPLTFLRKEEAVVFPREFYRFLWPSLLALPAGEKKQSLQLAFLASLKQAKLISTESSQLLTEDLALVVAEALAEPLGTKELDLRHRP